MMFPSLLRHIGLLACLLTWLSPAKAGGEPLDLPNPGSSPKRIVSLAPSITETLFALGVGDRLVGVTTFCNYPPEALEVAKIGSFTNPSLEPIMAKEPDLIVGLDKENDPVKLKTLETLGFRVLRLSVSTLEGTFASMKVLARVVGKEKRGKMLIDHIQFQIDGIKKRLLGVPRKRVLLLVGYQPLIAAGPRSFLGQLLMLAGGENIISGTYQTWPILSPEILIAKAPQVIIEAGMGSERGDRVQNWEDLASLPAVQEKRIYSYPSDKILRPGPRLGEAIEDLARLIHPERFRKSHDAR